ncbi:hypothetical protein PRIC1_014488 [Phytophthora ramorum]
MDKGLVQPEKLEKLGIHKEGMKKTLTEEASEGWKEIEGFVAGLGTRYSTKWLLCIVAKPLDIHLQVRQAAALASISSYVCPSDTAPGTNRCSRSVRSSRPLSSWPATVTVFRDGERRHYVLCKGSYEQLSSLSSVSGDYEAAS